MALAPAVDGVVKLTVKPGVVYQLTFA